MTFATLAARAHLTNRERYTWFPGAELRANVLFVADAERQGVILRCFLPLLRVYVPDLEVRVRQPEKSPPRASSAFKAGYRPSDLLD